MARAARVLRFRILSGRALTSTLMKKRLRSRCHAFKNRDTSIEVAAVLLVQFGRISDHCEQSVDCGRHGGSECFYGGLWLTAADHTGSLILIPDQLLNECSARGMALLQQTIYLAYSFGRFSLGIACWRSHEQHAATVLRAAHDMCLRESQAGLQ